MTKIDWAQAEQLRKILTDEVEAMLNKHKGYQAGAYMYALSDIYANTMCALYQTTNGGRLPPNGEVEQYLKNLKEHFDNLISQLPGGREPMQ